MPVAALDTDANAEALEITIADWLNVTTPTSINHLDVEAIGPNRVLVTLIYTA